MTELRPGMAVHSGWVLCNSSPRVSPPQIGNAFTSKVRLNAAIHGHAPQHGPSVPPRRAVRNNAGALEGYRGCST